jgi:hypothetical protein
MYTYAYTVSQKAVPLTIIKGAGNEYIPIPEGESAIVADFHSYVSSPKHTISIPHTPTKQHSNSPTTFLIIYAASALKPPIPQPT